MNPLPAALIQLAEDRATVLGDVLNKLARQKLASNAAEILVKATRDTVVRIRARCKEILRTTESHESLLIEREGRVLNTFLEFLENQLIPLLERSNITFTSPEFVAPIVRIAKQLHSGSDVLVVAVRENNYKFAIIGKALHRNFETVNCKTILIERGISENLRLLQFCATPPNGILTHSLMAHELAHGLYLQHKLADMILPLIHIDDTKIKQLVDSTSSAPVNVISESTPHQVRLGEVLDRSFIEFNIRNKINKIISDWVEEFACDVMGICLFGPAFLFSQLYFLIPVENLDNAHDTHPSLRMRLQFCYISLMGSEEGLGYREAKSLTLDVSTLSWKEVLFEKKPTAGNEELQIAYDCIRPVLPKIRSLCKKIVLPHSMTVDKFDSVVPQLCSRLSQVLPPNEYCDTTKENIIKADFVSILNAGWVYHLGWYTESPNFLDALCPDNRRQKVLSLIQGAVEMSEFDQVWREATKNVGTQ